MALSLPLRASSADLCGLWSRVARPSVPCVPRRRSERPGVQERTIRHRSAAVSHGCTLPGRREATESWTFPTGLSCVLSSSDQGDSERDHTMAEGEPAHRDQDQRHHRAGELGRRVGPPLRCLRAGAVDDQDGFEGFELLVRPMTACSGCRHPLAGRGVVPDSGSRRPAFAMATPERTGPRPTAARVSVAIRALVLRGGAGVTPSARRCWVGVMRTHIPGGGGASPPSAGQRERHKEGCDDAKRRPSANR